MGCFSSGSGLQRLAFAPGVTPGAARTCFPAFFVNRTKNTQTATFRLCVCVCARWFNFGRPGTDLGSIMSLQVVGGLLALWFGAHVRVGAAQPDENRTQLLSAFEG